MTQCFVSRDPGNTCNTYMHTFTGKSYGLKISRVKKAEDEGSYSIEASNSFGKCSASCQLAIIGQSVEESWRIPVL